MSSENLISYKNKTSQICNSVLGKCSSVRPKNTPNLHLKEEIKKAPAGSPW